MKSVASVMKEKKYAVDFAETETPGALYELQKLGKNVLWADNSLGVINKHNNNMSYVKTGELVLYLGRSETSSNLVSFLLPSGDVGYVSVYILGRISFYGLVLKKVKEGNNAQV